MGRAVRGSLRTVRPDDLGALVLREAIARVPGLAADEIDDVILGCAMPEGPQGMNVGRIAALRAGIPYSVPAMTVNRFCASGLETIAIAAQRIQVGAADLVVAGGAESMSMVPMGGRSPLPNPHLVEEYARRLPEHGADGRESGPELWNLARGARRLCLAEPPESLGGHRRAAASRKRSCPCRSNSSPWAEMENGKRKSRRFMVDECPRRETSREALAALKPAFHAKGSVTAGNASQMSDGAAAVVVVSEEKVKQLGLTPLARFVGYATAGVPPEVMGIGPTKAIPKVLAACGVEGRRPRPD